jgi:hypothetical protein
MKSQVYTEEFNSIAYLQYRIEEYLLRRIKKNMFCLQTYLKIGDGKIEGKVPHMLVCSKFPLLNLYSCYVSYYIPVI